MKAQNNGFAFLSGSSDKTMRKWFVNTRNENLQGTQVRIGLLCDEFSHFKKIKPIKEQEDSSNDLGQVRVICQAKIGNDGLILWGDSWGYLWIFDAKTLILSAILESHQDEIIDISIIKTKNFEDFRNNLIVSCSRDKTVRSFKYQNEELVEVDDFTSSPLPVIGLDFIHKEGDSIKLVYIDAKSNLCLREIKQNLTFDSAVTKNMSPKKFYTLAVRNNRIAIGTDTKIQFGELKSKNYWALMKSAGGNQSLMKDFVKLEIDETNTYVFSSCWKSNDVNIWRILEYLWN